MATIKGFEVSGTIYENEDETARQDISNLPAYIRNQNLISDPETLTVKTSASDPIVFDYDGIFYMYQKNSASGGGVYLQDDSGDWKAIGWLEGGSGYARTSFTIPVKKGWKLYGENASGWTGSTLLVFYYKQRDYSGR